MQRTVHSTLLTDPYCAMDRWVENRFTSLVSEGFQRSSCVLVSSTSL